MLSPTAIITGTVVPFPIKCSLARISSRFVPAKNWCYIFPVVKNRYHNLANGIASTPFIVTDKYTGLNDRNGERRF